MSDCPVCGLEYTPAISYMDNKPHCPRHADWKWRDKYSALADKLERAKGRLKEISVLEHTGACDPDDPPQSDCGVCIAEVALKEMETS